LFAHGKKRVEYGNCNRGYLLVRQSYEVDFDACRAGYSMPAGEYLEDRMKKLALAAAFATVGSGAMAMSHAKGEVMMEPVVVVEEAQQTSTSAGILIPLLVLVVLAAATNN
jgi:hypothetical protein